MRWSKSDFHLRGSDAATEQRADTGKAGVLQDEDDDDDDDGDKISNEVDVFGVAPTVDASRTSPEPTVTTVSVSPSSLAIIVDTRLSTSEQTSPLLTATHRGRVTRRAVDLIGCAAGSTGRQIVCTALAASSCAPPPSRRMQ